MHVRKESAESQTSEVLCFHTKVSAGTLLLRTRLLVPVRKSYLGEIKYLSAIHKLADISNVVHKFEIKS